jgi:NadR type nicotinamide-nucleotide adenylyltransferase
MEENLKQHPSVTNEKTVLRIAFYGPESTGKSTIAAQLAEAFDTVWAPEFARNYLQDKWNESGAICQPEDLLPIAIGQTQLENQKLQQANRFLFCDTNVLVTKVFGDIYYGSVDPLVEKAAKKHKYDLIFLTDVDVPWEADDLRDRPDNRQETLRIFEENLKGASLTPWPSPNPKKKSDHSRSSLPRVCMKTSRPWHADRACR